VDCNKDAEHKDYIAMFWKVYKEFSYEDKKALFRKWIGRSRIGWKQHTLGKEKFRIRLDADLDESGVPTSKPDQLELILPERAYENEEKFKEKLLVAMKEGVGLDRPIE